MAEVTTDHHPQCPYVFHHVGPCLTPGTKANLVQGVAAEDFEAVKITVAQLEVTGLLACRYKALAQEIIALLPPSAHRSAALRQLLEAKMTTVHAISRSSEAHLG